jgi:hypothetical protein
VNLKTLKAMALTGQFNFESGDSGDNIETTNVFEQPAQPVHATAGMNSGR